MRDQALLRSKIRSSFKNLMRLWSQKRELEEWRWGTGLIATGILLPISFANSWKALPAKDKKNAMNEWNSLKGSPMNAVGEGTCRAAAQQSMSCIYYWRTGKWVIPPRSVHCLPLALYRFSYTRIGWHSVPRLRPSYLIIIIYFIDCGARA